MEVGFVPPGYRSDIPSRDRRGAISAEVYHDEEIKNFSRKVKVLNDFCHEKNSRKFQVVPKDYKTMQALQRVFENIKLLKSCDEGKVSDFSIATSVICMTHMYDSYSMSHTVWKC